MLIDVGQVTAALVTTLAPFAPILIDVGKAGGQKFAEMIGEKGGEATWEKVQALWREVKVRFGDDPEVIDAVTMVAAKPNDETRQTVLAEVLGARLKADPDLTERIFKLLGGSQVVQQVLAERRSWVEDVTQQLEGPSGGQGVIARDDSSVRGVKQNIQHR